MEAVFIGEKMTQVLPACPGHPTTLHHGTFVLEGASTLSPVDVFDVFDLRERRRACKTTCLPMETPSELESVCSPLQSFTAVIHC